MASTNNKTVQVLTLDPTRELKFKGSFLEPIHVELRLTNPTKKRTAFKIKTTAPKQYTVRPSSGVIDPNDKTLIILTLHPFEFDPDEKYSHKFMVQSVVVPDGITDMELLWRETTIEQRMDSKLRCILEYMLDPNAKPSTPKKRAMEDLKAEQFHLVEENNKLKEDVTRLRKQLIEAETSYPGSHHGPLCNRPLQFLFTLLIAIVALVAGLYLGKYYI